MHGLCENKSLLVPSIFFPQKGSVLADNSMAHSPVCQLPLFKKLFPLAFRKILHGINCQKSNSLQNVFAALSLEVPPSLQTTQHLLTLSCIENPLNSE